MQYKGSDYIIRGHLKTKSIFQKVTWVFSLPHDMNEKNAPTHIQTGHDISVEDSSLLLAYGIRRAAGPKSPFALIRRRDRGAFESNLPRKRRRTNHDYRKIRKTSRYSFDSHHQ